MEETGQQGEEMSEAVLGEDEIGDEDFEDDFEDPEHNEVIRAKWMLDGTVTLSEAAGKLRAEADWLEQLERDGWQLERPVEDDYGFIHKD
jgi:hypothetical protein